MRLQLVVNAVEGVPNGDRRVAGDIGRAPDRIEIGEINLRHEAQCPGRRALRNRGTCEPAGCEVTAPPADFRNALRSMMKPLG